MSTSDNPVTIENLLARLSQLESSNASLAETVASLRSSPPQPIALQAATAPFSFATQPTTSPTATSPTPPAQTLPQATAQQTATSQGPAIFTSTDGQTPAVTAAGNPGYGLVATGGAGVDTTGKPIGGFGIVASGTSVLDASGNVVSAPAVYAYDASGKDASGKPVPGYAVYATSDAGIAMSAISKDGIGLYAAGGDIGATGNALSGTGIYATGTSKADTTGAVTPVPAIRAIGAGTKDANGNEIPGVGVYASSNTGVGVHAQSTSGMSIYAEGNVGIGTTTPTRPLSIRAERAGEELISFENPAGQTKWHFNQNLGGNNPGFNIVETGVADGRLFIQAGGNVGIGTTAPSAKLNIDPQGPGGIVIGNPSTGQGGFTSLLMDINAASGGSARIQAIKSSGTAWGETDINPDGGNVGVGLTGARTQFHVLGRISTGLDFNTAGSVTFFPPDGFAWFHIDNGPAGGRPIGMLRFSDGGNPGDHILMTIDQNGNVTIPGTLSVNGAKHFVQDHPADPTQEIVYTSLEGGEAGTYTRGTWKLEDGKAVIELPEHFGMVTSEDGLTVQLTPRGEWLQLYVVQLTTRRLIVQEAEGKSGQFDYLIQGVRKGYEHHEVIREKR